MHIHNIRTKHIARYHFLPGAAAAREEVQVHTLHTDTAHNTGHITNLSPLSGAAAVGEGYLQQTDQGGGVSGRGGDLPPEGDAAYYAGKWADKSDQIASKISK